MHYRSPDRRVCMSRLGVPRRVFACALVTALAIGCIDRETAQKAIESVQESAGVRPDTMPAMLNSSPPFRYPPSLYAEQVQGNVTLRIRIDTTGKITPESTMVVESSGYPALDSAALIGSHQLRFSPAKLHGQPMSISILLPVFFRHPGSPPLPGDSILHDSSSAHAHRTP
ncbi:MAG TPA: energy transducer TonB [Gemmatimonadaceae bacterium]